MKIANSKTKQNLLENSHRLHIRFAVAVSSVYLTFKSMVTPGLQLFATSAYVE